MRLNPRLLICLLIAARAYPAAAAVASSQPVVTIDPTRLAAADAAILAAIEEHNLPGAVLLVSHNGRIIHEKAYGQRAVQPQPVPMSTDTVFDLASLSKPIGCATSIMLLAERGKLKPSDPVAKFIPAFAANGKEAITIEQLLVHTSGLIPDNPLSDYTDGPAAAFAKINALRPLNGPGRQFMYSDVNYIMLGRLVQIIDGRPLERFVREEIFLPLMMNQTLYNPPEALKSRCAPTQKRGDHWMVGEVHDPRAFALGGVAGHAGVFSTAQDLARFCQMLLNGGELDGQRVLSEDTVRIMTQPRSLPDNLWRTYGFDVDTPYSLCRGDRFDPGTTFGHTGFTGAMLWIDPKNNCFFILLTNSVHPDGSGDVRALRRQVATFVAEAILGPTPPRAGASVRMALNSPRNLTPSSGSPAPVLCGIDVLKNDNFKLLEGRRIALITNHSGRDREGKRTIDLLMASKNLTVVRLLSPEHGLYGALDEKVGNTTDAATGLPVFSLYGQTVRPTAEMLQGIDTIVYDIQDVGARFYTYITTLGYCMEAAAKYKLKMVVLDRPNPITGLIVDGPLADADQLSFIAFAPIPVAHGMTLGELAQYYNSERSIHCDLAVVPLQGWRRTLWFDETGLLWVNPSPNMRNLTQAALYPGVCLLEACNVSVGRGTDQPFEIFGAPWIDARKLAATLNGARLAGLRFVPIEFTPKSSKFANQPCQGIHITITDRNAIEPVRAGLTIAWHLKKLFGDAFDIDKVGHLLRNKAALTLLKESRNPTTLPALWETDVKAFKESREKYLIYR
jgi:uncharacterized protein YbbC (DUF1343 family)